jgi:hypothetical protein
LDDSIAREEEAAKRARDAIFRAEAQRLAIPPPDVERFLAARRGHAREWMRAADLDSPSPRGHYLRDFGQSDRDMIENANPEATIGQALVLMNSGLFEAITQPFTQLSLNVAGARYPEEQLDAVYQTLLTRRPRPSEIAAWQAARKDGLDSIEDLVYALINTQQFLFVQ